MRPNWPYLHSEHIYSLTTIGEAITGILNRLRKRFRRRPDPMETMFDD